MHERYGQRFLGVMFLAIVLEAIGCGGDGHGGPPPVSEGAPYFTTDYGAYMYGFAVQEGNQGVNGVWIHSDGSNAVLLLVVGNSLEKPQAARIVTHVADSLTLGADGGQLNLDADSDALFTNNDFVPAHGFLALDTARQTVSTVEDGIQVGAPLQVTYELSGPLFRVAPLDTPYGPAITWGDILYGEGYPRP